MLVFVLSLLLFDFGSSRSILVEDILDFGHVLLFGAVSLVFLWLMNGKAWPVHRLSYYLASFSAAAALGAATEFLQIASPVRDGGFGDIVRDALGSLIFLILSYPYRADAGRRIKYLKALSIMALFLATTPVQLSSLETWRMRHDFPVINSFERWWETKSWSPTRAALMRSKEHATHGSHALETRFEPGAYPGIALENFNGDWRGYDALSFDVFLEGDKPLAVMVRINDASHNWRFHDRFNKKLTLAPGSNRIVIDLKEVRQSPRKRLMDMQNITGVVIFSHDLKEQRTLFFDNFRLER